LKPRRLIGTNGNAQTPVSTQNPPVAATSLAPFGNVRLYCVALHATLTSVIISFRHKGLETLYRTGSARGVQAAHAPKLGRILAALDAAISPAELDQPGYKLHHLKGALKGHWSVWANGNWRVTFRFVGTDVELVDYQDYH